MVLQEKHHACILAAYYTFLKKYLGDSGLIVFRKAEQYYGERRGRRMALRALREGKKLDYSAYFEYGELLSTIDAYDVSFLAKVGCVHEYVSRCPWANEFERLSCLECGEFYCSEIDAAVVRGFNPLLNYSLLGNIYAKGCCEFLYQDNSIRADLFESITKPISQDAKKNFNFHCADVYQAFSHTINMTYPGQFDVIMKDVREYLQREYGNELLIAIDVGSSSDHEII